MDSAGRTGLSVFLMVTGQSPPFARRAMYRTFSWRVSSATLRRASPSSSTPWTRHALEPGAVEELDDQLAREMPLLVARRRRARRARRRAGRRRRSGRSHGTPVRRSAPHSPRQTNTIAVALAHAVAREGGPVRAQRVQVEDRQAAPGEVAPIPSEGGGELVRVEQVVQRVVEARDEVEAADHRQVADVGVDELASGALRAASASIALDESQPVTSKPRSQERQEALARAAGEVENACGRASRGGRRARAPARSRPRSPTPP